MSNESLARVVGWRTLEDMPWVFRCRVRRVFLTRKQVFEVVRTRGRTDAARGRPISDADRLPRPYRDGYLDGYMEPTGNQ